MSAPTTARYRPPRLEPTDDPRAPVRLRAAATAGELADELHAELARNAPSRRALHDLRAQARVGFRTVLRHARARRAAGHAEAPFHVRYEPTRADHRPVAKTQAGRRGLR